MSDQVAEKDVRDMDAKPRFSTGDVLKMEMETEEYEVPGYGKTVLIQALNAAEQAEYQASMYQVMSDSQGKVSTTADFAGRNIKAAHLGLRDPKLTIEQLRSAPNDFVQPIAERIREISGMNVSVEEAEGN